MKKIGNWIYEFELKRWKLSWSVLYCKRIGQTGTEEKDFVVHQLAYFNCGFGKLATTFARGFWLYIGFPSFNMQTDLSSKRAIGFSIRTTDEKTLH